MRGRLFNIRLCSFYKLKLLSIHLYHKESQPYNNKMSEEEIGPIEPREKIHLEIKLFNKETKEEFNQPATFNHIDNDSQLPIKLEIFPKQLLGLPIYDLGPRPNEKVNYIIIFHKILFYPDFPDILCCLITI